MAMQRNFVCLILVLSWLALATPALPQKVYTSPIDSHAYIEGLSQKKMAMHDRVLCYTFESFDDITEWEYQTGIGVKLRFTKIEALNLKIRSYRKCSRMHIYIYNALVYNTLKHEC